MTNLKTVRARFARNTGLPFAQVLTEAKILDVLNEHGIKYRDRVFNPVTTIWGFLTQVLSDDHSCRDAVSRIIAHRAATASKSARPIPPATATPAAACTRTSCAPWRSEPPRSYRRAAEEWKWNGRKVFIADGSHVSMPDTPAEPGELTHSRRRRSRGSASRWPGSPCCCRWRPAPVMIWPSHLTRARAPARPRCCGRCTTRLKPGDVVLADALFDNYFLVCELRERGIDLVARVKCQRVGSQTVAERARRRHHRLAAAEQAAWDDGGAIPHATPRACSCGR